MRDCHYVYAFLIAPVLGLCFAGLCRCPEDSLMIVVGALGLVTFLVLHGSAQRRHR